MKKNLCTPCFIHEFMMFDIENISYKEGMIDGIKTNVDVKGNLAVIDGILHFNDGLASDWQKFNKYSNVDVKIFEKEDCNDDSLIAFICPKNPNLPMIINQHKIEPCMHQEVLSYDEGTGFNIVKSAVY